MTRTSWLACLSLGLGLSACTGGTLPPPPANCTLSSNITTPTTLSPATCATYLVSKTLEVSTALTVQPGAVLQFAANAGLQILETGSLNATGTAAAPITFTGATATAGFWRGLAFRSNDPANKLVYANILFAGSTEFCCDYFEGANQKGAVMLGGATLDSPVQVTITNTTVSRSGGYGVYLFATGTLPGFASNTFKGNTQAPVSLPVSRIGALDSASIYSGGTEPNTEQFVRVLEADNATNITQTVRKLDVPYRVSAGLSGRELEYKGSLTVNAGVTLEFEADSGLFIPDTGSLTVNGTVTEPVTFRGRLSSRGYWKGINILSVGNTITHATIRDAGSSVFCCAQNSDAKAGLSIGDFFSDSTASVSVSNTSFTNNVFGIFNDEATGNVFTDGGGNTFSNNTTDKNF
ncbi:MAG: hypothetical protein HC933_09390 [Pleurocapsa sp. SU_196_0]|nr:hypothetical protein [Pleurocapsa sp. SU_196_0]